MSGEIVLPDFFVGFLASQPVIHPHHDPINEASLSTIGSELSLSAKRLKHHQRGELAYFASVMLPDASNWALRVALDWLHWVFEWDEYYDESGNFHEDREASNKCTAETLGVLEGKTPVEEAGMHRLFHNIFNVVKENGSANGIQRWVEAQRGYILTVAQQVGPGAKRSFDSIADYDDFRSRTIGVRPLFNFASLAYGVELPESVWAHPALARLELTTIRLISIHNDCFSYFKEQRDAKKAGLKKHIYNVLAVMHELYGIGCQQGMDMCGEMAAAAMDEITELLGEIQALGSTLEAKERVMLDTYVEGLLNTARANLWWSYKTKWYFGDRNEQVFAAGVVVEKEHE